MIEISKDGTININGWQEGIGNSNLDNFSDIILVVYLKILNFNQL